MKFEDLKKFPEDQQPTVLAWATEVEKIPKLESDIKLLRSMVQFFIDHLASKDVEETK